MVYHLCVLVSLHHVKKTEIQEKKVKGIKKNQEKGITRIEKEIERGKEAGKEISLVRNITGNVQENGQKKEKKSIRYIR